MRDLNQIMRSGYVRRWHANPDMAHIPENLAEHHCRVAQIILALHPSPSLALIDAALHHDCGEMRVGDVSYEAKHSNAALANALYDAECAAMLDMGLAINLGADDAAWLKFADRLAAYLHVKHYRPELLHGRDWRLAIERLVTMRDDLGCKIIL